MSTSTVTTPRCWNCGAPIARECEIAIPSGVIKWRCKCGVANERKV